MKNVLKFEPKKEDLKKYLLMHIQQVGFDPDDSSLFGLMVIAFKNNNGQIELIKPSHLELDKKDFYKGMNVNPILLSNFVAPEFTLDEVLNVPPVFGNMSFSKYASTDVQLDDMTILQMHGTDDRMLCYLVDGPKQNEDTFLSVINFKVPVEYSELEPKDNERRYETLLDLENFEMEITGIQSIIQLGYDNADTLVSVVKNDVAQSMNFDIPIEKVTDNAIPNDLRDLFNLALKLSYTTEDSVLMGQLKDMYRIYAEGIKGNLELKSFR